VSLTFTFPYVNTPAFYTGTSSSALVPDVFPVAINGRPYVIDQRSNQFTRAFEQRVRDSVDQSTAPGEAAINPGGLWRRGEVSWHLGAGQKYADTAEGQDYRFYKSKGVNPWDKGQLTLLNATKRALTSSSTNLKMVEAGGYVYVADNQTLKYTTDPFAATPSWTSVTGGPSETINDIATDGKQVYVAYEDEGILMTAVGGASMANHYATSGGTYNYTALGFAKGFIVGVHNDTANTHVHVVPYVASTSHGTATTTIRDPNFVCVGIVGGQNHIYIAGRGGDSGLVYRMGIKTVGTLDVAIVALELPIGEYCTGIYSYLGSIILGTNKGVRFCSSDAAGNLISGALIPTGADVQGFTGGDRFVWFGWTNYDGTSGLGRLDLSVFTTANTPAFASDLMHADSGQVKAVASLNNKRLYTISGFGVIAEDTDNLVVSGNIESGIYRWGIPDRKFIARVDTRSTPLVGTISSYMSLDAKDYQFLGVLSGSNTTENSFNGSDDHAIEAQFKFVLGRETATTGPTLTRWTARAYAAPFRSEVFRIPIMLHEQIKVHDKDYFFDVNEELFELRKLINKPRIVTLQVREETVSVIIEDMEWTPIDSVDKDWLWQGTVTVTMRSVQG
jgi:hypothetical protein